MWRPFSSFCPVKEFAEKITKKELCFPVGGRRPRLLGAIDQLEFIASLKGEEKVQGCCREGLLGRPESPPPCPFQGCKALGKSCSSLTGREKGAWEAERPVGKRGISRGKGRGSPP